MARGSAGSWLEGPGSGRPAAVDDAPGASLGLPAAGTGSVAGQGRRALGFLYDVLAALVVGAALRLVDRGVGSGTVGLTQTGFLLAEVLVLQVLGGASVGQRFAGTRLVSVYGGGRPRARWVLLRTFLLALPVPGAAALATDADGRGLHDRAAGTVVVRA